MCPTTSLRSPNRWSTVVNGAKLAQVFPGETAAVLGGGPIGQLYTALLKLAGCQVITVEPTEERRQLATTMGADRVVDPARRTWPYPSGTPLQGLGQMSSSMRSVPSCRTRLMWFERPVVSFFLG